MKTTRKNTEITALGLAKKITNLRLKHLNDVKINTLNFIGNVPVVNNVYNFKNSSILSILNTISKTSIDEMKKINDLILNLEKVDSMLNELCTLDIEFTKCMFGNTLDIYDLKEMTGKIVETQLIDEASNENDDDLPF